MNFTIITIGSRGDIQPYSALAHGLMQRGHHVKLAAPETLRDSVCAAGMDFIPLDIDMKGLLRIRDRNLKKKLGRFGRLKQDRKRLASTLPSMIDEALEACRGAEILLFGGTSFVFSEQIREVLGTPGMNIFLQPLIPTHTAAPLFLPVNSLGPFNIPAYRLMEKLMWMMYRPGINIWRKQRGMPEIHHRNLVSELFTEREPILNGYSPHVFPHPRDWCADHFISGYWFSDSGKNYTPPADLVDFLESGPRPVYIGFGSMSIIFGDSSASIINEAVEMVGCRAVYLTGWATKGETPLSPRIYCGEDIPHDWLFPRVAAVVHHGGAGTTAAGLRAGKPTQIVAHISDQKFWGVRVKALGAGPGYIPRRKLTATKLAAALRALLNNKSFTENAESLGHKIRAEDGLRRAVDFIEAKMLTGKKMLEQGA